MKQTRNNGFTLAELLAVVAILAIVLAVSIPAFVGMNRSSNLDASVAELRATVQLARQWAITHRTNVHVVFPDTAASSLSDTGMAYRAYNVFDESEGEYIGEWRFLKPGVFFIPSQSVAPTKMSAPTKDSINPFRDALADKIDVVFPYSDSGSSESLPAISFRKNGQLLDQGIVPREVYLAEGIPTGSAVKFLDESAVFGVHVTSLTGGMKVFDYKIAP